jgi:hypothetical protein
MKPEAPAQPLVMETRNTIIPSPKPGPLPTPGLTGIELLDHAISLLEQGKPAQARVDLQSYLRTDPENAIARRLLSHIDTPIEEIFPRENFTIVLQNRQTLFSLAVEYMNDSVGFYALARYNGIENPARVTVEQSIKIPATATALAARDAKRAAIESDQAALAAQEAETEDAWARIVSNVEAERFGAAIQEAEAKGVAPEGEDAALLARAYAGVARELETSAKLLAGSRALRAGQLYLESKPTGCARDVRSRASADTGEHFGEGATRSDAAAGRGCRISGWASRFSAPATRRCDSAFRPRT